MSERNYKNILDKFLDGSLSAEAFVNEYFNQWKNDRDASVAYDTKFHRIIDRIFTNCDCYSSNPTHEIDISEKELRKEVELLRYVWWGSLNSN